MSRNRKNAELNKKKRRHEEALDRKTAGGINDPTPHAAVENLRTHQEGLKKC